MAPGAMLKNIFVRNLLFFILSYRVCPWQAFTALPNVCGKTLAYYEHSLIFYDNGSWWQFYKTFSSVIY
jgi:hypothetical protein